MKIWAIALNTWRETMRDRVLLGALVGLVAIVAVAAGLEGPEGHGTAALDLALSLLSGIGALIAIFLGTSLVHKELDRRTAYIVLAKPVTRFQFLLGKYLGLVATLTGFLAIAAVGLGLLMALLGHVEPRIYAVLVAIWLEINLVTAIAFCFATMTSAVLSALYAAGLYVLSQQTIAIKQFAAYEAPRHPIEAWIGQAIYAVLPNFGALDYKNLVLYAGRLPWHAWAWSLAYGALAIASFLCLAALAWEERELL